MSYTLRNLPLPVKLVASVFLMAVGVGYTSAMVQLHMQDAKSGKPMPTVEDVILKYTGKVKFDPNHPPPPPVCRLEALIMCPTEDINSSSMSGAFLRQDTGARGRSPEATKAFRAERAGEQTAIQLWINTPEEHRKKAYDGDKFIPPTGKMPKTITPAFCAKSPDGDAIKIKSIVDKRCAVCHSPGGEKEKIPLDNYDGLARYMSVEAATFGEWVKVEEPVSITKLTQSTHAHLLSFAMLFSLTGVIFAFSSYPTSVRCILGPWVVLALFADVSLWWLARLSDQWGPYFAMGIIGTGAAAGLGLAAQIILSLFNMYGMKGKIVLALLFLLGGGIAGLVFMEKIKPELEAKASAAQKSKEPPKDDKNDGNGQKSNGPPINTIQKPHRPVNALDELLTLPRLDEKGNPIPDPKFNGGASGSMVPAFFEKDKAYKKKMEDPATPQAIKDQMKAERQAELDAALAWIRSAEAARKAAYETDSLEVPPALLGKVTTQFVKDGKVQIKSIIGTRCGACHAPEKKQEEWPLTTYEELSKYLQPLAQPETPPAPEKPAPAPGGPTAPTKATEPIPPAKDD